MKWKIILILAVTITVYTIIGGIVLHFLESGQISDDHVNIEKAKAIFLDCHADVTEKELDDLIFNITGKHITSDTNSSQIDPWNIHTSIFFASTVISTVGYGNFTPKTSPGRSWCVCFALFGIPLFLLLLGSLGAKYHKLQRRALGKLGLEKIKHDGLKEIVMFLIQLGSGCFVCGILPAFFFVYYEDGWKYKNAYYFCAITILTIGFGDYHPALENLNNPFFSAVFGIWFFFSLTWMSAVVNSVQEVLQHFVVREAAETVVREAAETDNTRNPSQIDRNIEKSQTAGNEEKVGISNPGHISS